MEVQHGVEPGLGARDRPPDTVGGVEDGGDDAAGRRTDLRPGGCLGDDPSRRVGARRPGNSAAPPLGAGVGYVIEGAVRFELEGELERVVEAGGTFWEPGGDPIHYQDGNALADARTRFVVTMMCAPGKPMLELVDAEELEQRAHLRAPRPTD